MKFYIQKNISEKDISELISVFIKYHIDYELFYHIPFDDSYPVIDKSKTSFVYAASTVTDKIIEDNKKFCGVFAHTKDIDLSQFFNNSPELMWNQPIYMGAFKNFVLSEKEIFIRPLVDSKWIAGMVLNEKEYYDWKEKLENIDFNFNEPIFVSKVNPPKDEFRLFFVNKIFSTGSQYKKNFELHKNKTVPTEVIVLAQNFIEKNMNQLPLSFVVDVGVNESQIGVIEVNGINNAGFYEIDKEKLIMDFLKYDFN